MRTNMYPSRQPRDEVHERRGGYGVVGNDYLESRRAQRESSTFSIWPPSPKAPARTLSPERGSTSRRKSKRDVKPAAVAPIVTTSASQIDDPESPPVAIPSSSHSERLSDEDDESDLEVGPQPLLKATTSKRVDERAYGGALLRGEGSAMAAFLQDDPQSRIPRRGEIGLTSDEIAQFEAVGYVMSGSRHKRMNAVRMRKENQVISAEEKRGILKLQKEERERREAILREEFNELVHDRLKGPEVKRTVT